MAVMVDGLCWRLASYNGGGQTHSQSCIGHSRHFRVVDWSCILEDVLMANFALFFLLIHFVSCSMVFISVILSIDSRVFVSRYIAVRQMCSICVPVVHGRWHDNEDIFDSCLCIFVCNSCRNALKPTGIECASVCCSLDLRLCSNQCTDIFVEIPSKMTMAGCLTDVIDDTTYTSVPQVWYSVNICCSFGSVKNIAIHLKSLHVHFACRYLQNIYNPKW